MALKDKINEDLKASMKSGDKLRLETVRSVRALILEFDKSGAGRELTPEEEISLINSAVKKRRDAIEQYQKAGRIDLSSKEEAELKILQEYLPKQLSDGELNEEIKNIAVSINAQGKEDFPKLMPLAAKSLKGKAEGKAVKLAVEKYLGIS